MRHQHGIRVELVHRRAPYDEHKVPVDKSLFISPRQENISQNGAFITEVSQVAVRRHQRNEDNENIELRLVFESTFRFFAANDIRIRVCVHDSNGCVNRDYVFSKDDARDRQGGGVRLPWNPRVPHPSRMPQPRQEAAQSTKEWKTQQIADQGSITVFVTRGNIKSDSGAKKATAASRLRGFERLQSPNGRTYCFEFQCRPKGFSFPQDVQGSSKLQVTGPALKVPGASSGEHSSESDDVEETVPVRKRKILTAKSLSGLSKSTVAAGAETIAPIKAPANIASDMVKYTLSEATTPAKVATSGLRADKCRVEQPDAPRTSSIHETARGKRPRVEIDLAAENYDFKLQMKQDIMGQEMQSQKLAIAEDDAADILEDEEDDLKDLLLEVQTRIKLRALKRRKLAEGKTG